MNSCIDAGGLSRFVHRSANAELAVLVRQHIQCCADCRERLTLMQGFADNLFDDMRSAKNGPAAQDCPSAIQLQHYVQGTLSERQMVQLQLHLGECPLCEVPPGDHSVSSSPGSAQTSSTVLRRADLDVRWTPEGLLFASGSEWLDDRPRPTLVERLKLSVAIAPTASIGSSRFFHFALPHQHLRGRLQLHSPEAFSVQLAVNATAEDSLQVWTRHHTGPRYTIRGGSWETGMLLPRGHYFIGPEMAQEPWLALHLDESVATLQQLAWLGWDHCLYGRLHSAAYCLGQWAMQSRSADAATRSYQCCRELAATHGMQHGDVPLLLEDQISRRQFKKDYAILLLRLQESLPESP